MISVLPLRQMKEVEEDKKVLSATLKTSESEVLNLEQQFRELRKVLWPNETPPSSPSREHMTVPGKLKLMVGQVKNITKEVTKLKKDNEQLKYDVKHVYYPLLSKKGKSAYNCIERVHTLIMMGNAFHNVDMKKYVCYYDPHKDDADQDRCVKGHPLCAIAQKCTKMTPSEGEGHIYVALLRVHGQWKHYVGQAKDWRKRWQTDSTSHEWAIEEAGKCLWKFDLFRLLKLKSILRCDLEMGKTILLEFILNNQSAPGPAIVVYKIQSKLDKSVRSTREQHFMNAFRNSGSIELNGRNECKHHVHESMKCRFTEYRETCRSRLEQSISQGRWL